ncbi:MAG: CheF family chemotaxis protein [Halobacteriales archaeon]
MASESVAQFSGSILADVTSADEPATSQIILDRDLLCIDSVQGSEDEPEGDEGLSIEIPLDSIVDIVIGPPPQAIADQFTTETVTISYGNDDRHVLHVGHPEQETLTRFGNILFMSILNETDIIFRRPVEIGRDVTNQSPVSGKLYLRQNTVHAVNPDDAFTIPLNTVIDFATCRRDFNDEEKACVAVSYLRDGASMHAEIAVESNRKINLLGRYLRRQYRQLREALNDFDLSKAEIKLLVKLCSLGGEATVQSLLPERSKRSFETLAKLDGRGLVTVYDGQITMSPEGWIIATDEIGH